jgi:ATP-dependent DNA helicase RecG
MDNNTLISLIDGLLINGNESACIEFKRNWNDSKDIGEYVSALGNSAVLEQQSSAWMIWGVDDKTHEVVGTTFDPSREKANGNQALVMWLMNKILPRPDIKFHDVSHPNGRCVVLEIRPPRMAPLAFDGERFIRIDSHKTSLARHPEKERRLWALLGPREDWTGDLVEGASLDDLDPDALVKARKLYTDFRLGQAESNERHEAIRQEVAALDTATFLNQALVTKQGKITRTALLLLGRDEAAHFLAPAEIKMMWLLRDHNNKPGPSIAFGLPFLLATEKLVAKIRNETVDAMPEGNLFPVSVKSYDNWVLREALHNCIAHQDYVLGGKINVVEHPDRLIFTNLGDFFPKTVESMLTNPSPPVHYRNQWLIGAMIRLRMIEQAGSGIKRMFDTQHERFFPLPDYYFGEDNDVPSSVELTIRGQYLDANYTRLLMARPDIDLRQVLLLDRVQKKLGLTAAGVKTLKQAGLIEGRAPNYFISAKMAIDTDKKSQYILNKVFNDDHYRNLVLSYLKKFGRADKAALESLLMDKMSDALDSKQKNNKIRNLLQRMRLEGVIARNGPKFTGYWELPASENA